MSKIDRAGKKIYIKPALEVIELRPDERIAKKSGQDNCSACQGGGTGCVPSAVHGGGY